MGQQPIQRLQIHSQYKEQLFRQAMKSEFNLDYARQTDIIAALRSAGIASNEMANFWVLVRAMAVSDDRFEES